MSAASAFFRLVGACDVIFRMDGQEYFGRYNGRSVNDEQVMIHLYPSSPSGVGNAGLRVPLVQIEPGSLHVVEDTGRFRVCARLIDSPAGHSYLTKRRVFSMDVREAVELSEADAWDAMREHQLLERDVDGPFGWLEKVDA